MKGANEITAATRLFMAGEFAAAEKAFAAIVQQAPDNGRAFYLYGLSCYKSGNLEKAAIQFRRAAALNPHDFDSRFNLAVALGEMKLYDEAIFEYKRLLDDVPGYAKALPNVAQLLIKAGAYDEGVGYFKRALAMVPADTHAGALLLEFQCMHLPMAERPACCDTFLAMPGLPDGYRHTALVYRAAAEWARGDINALQVTLAQAAAIRPQMTDQGYVNMNIYRTFLERLHAYRLARTDLYRYGGPALPVAGDSHSLTYAGLGVQFGGMRRTIQPHLMVGTKAWDIADPAQNVRRHALARFMAGLPVDGALLCAFGEIDCRMNHGIIPYAAKSGKSVESIVPGLVEGYITAVAGMAAARRLKLWFMAVPAPLAASGDRRHVVGLFNKFLSSRAAAGGHGYVNLHEATAAPGGYAGDGVYLDNYHLKPEILARLWDGPQGTGRSAQV